MDSNRERLYATYIKNMTELRELLDKLRPSQVLNRLRWQLELDLLEPKILDMSPETLTSQILGPAHSGDERDFIYATYDKTCREIQDAADLRIEMSDCVEGVLYRIRCRNSNCGIWLPEEKGFQIARTKFGSDFLTTEYHWDTGPPYGTARPYVMLEPLPTFMADEAKLAYLLEWREKLKQQGEQY
jgi:hypothetical protein